MLLIPYPANPAEDAGHRIRFAVLYKRSPIEKEGDARTQGTPTDRPSPRIKTVDPGAM